MEKKADWKELLAKALQDKRLIGAGLAGLGGGLVGGTLLPGLIWKNPTWGKRGIIGGTTGVLAALATLAAMGKGEPDSPAATVARNFTDLAANAGSVLTGDRPTTAELREMGTLAKTLKGYGDNPFAWTVRRIRGAFPDAQGLFGKSDKAKQREAAGQLPKTDDDPSKILAWGKLGVGGTAGALTGVKHYKNLLSRYKERTLADKITELYKSRPDAFKAALNKDRDILKVLDVWSKGSGPLLQPKQGIRANAENIWKRLKFGLGQKGQTMISNNSSGLANPWLKHIKLNKQLGASSIKDRITNRLTGSALDGFSKAVGNNIAKPSWGRKLWFGTRGAGRGLVTAALLGLLTEPFGGNDTQNLDTARDLYANLKQNK